jgi:hypothetical protein
MGHQWPHDDLRTIVSLERVSRRGFEGQPAPYCALASQYRKGHSLRRPPLLLIRDYLGLRNGVPLPGKLNPFNERVAQ